MIDQLLSLIAPHHCLGCAKLGPLLCDECKNNNALDRFNGCCVCLRPCRNGVCQQCQIRSARMAGFCVSWRRGLVKQLLDTYKFDLRRQGAKELAELLSETAPDLPATAVIVPIPTVRRHVRERGFDHNKLLARRFGRLRQLPVRMLLIRRTAAVQRGASRLQRLKQARTAFSARSQLNKNHTYVIIDDTITTGATVRAAAKTLYRAGARRIVIMAIARQP